ncbi:MAG: hypothetical protein DYH08_06130 [Actinobacteria bacterium ATB1]|nr:hypothetical protein [Actinobacteria bacterium ATB1]
MLLAGLLVLVSAVEIGVRVVARRPCRIGFYGSVAREQVRDLQDRVGVRTNSGPGWVHLGWVADPEREGYLVETWDGSQWIEAGRSRYGSFLARTGGRFRVMATDGLGRRRIGEVACEPGHGSPPVCIPRVAGPWRHLFRPAVHGNYVNDHCIFRDTRGNWRLVGITGSGNGDLDSERRLTVGVSEAFPPVDGMREEPAVADFGELAWAPCEADDGTDRWLFWSPHVLHRMRSPDGITWTDHEVVLSESVHPFFRDPAIVEVAPGQWLLYCTARGRWFSRVDLYQSFDLRYWQYIRGALSTGWGSERNSSFASTESPTVVRQGGRWYLAVTYTNGTSGFSGLLLTAHLMPDRASYNDTLLFHSDNPYDFGHYAGRRRGSRSAPTLAGSLEAHCPELVEHPDTGEWWVTTAGWPWAATLTSGEVAVAPLAWDAQAGPESA